MFDYSQVIAELGDNLLKLRELNDNVKVAETILEESKKERDSLFNSFKGKEYLPYFVGQLLGEIPRVQDINRNIFHSCRHIAIDGVYEIEFSVSDMSDEDKARFSEEIARDLRALFKKRDIDTKDYIRVKIS